jgi:hypothetical protein
MLRKKLLQVVTIFLLVAITATSCKKDLFNEKDAIAAQTDLLNLKYSKDADILKLKFSNDLLLKNIDVQIKNIDLQIQRVSDSAQFAMLRLATTLKFSADSTLERIKQANTLAQILQSYQNQRMLAMQADSLARGTATFNADIAKAKAIFDDNIAKAKKLYEDSVNLSASNKAATAAELAASKAAAAAAIAQSKAILRAMTRDYSVTVISNQNSVVSGAVVSVYPYGSTTLKTAITDSRGVARFTGIIVDPAAMFSVSAADYSGGLFQEQYFGYIGTVPVTEGTETYARDVKGRTAIVIDLVADDYANANLLASTNTIKGSIKGNLDLTNGGALEAVGGQLVTFSASLSYQYLGSTYSDVFTISTLSDKTTGLFSVKVPDGSWTASYASTIEADQKLFVNAWSDETQTTAIPSIRTTGATLATSGSNIASGNGRGYYLTTTADTITAKSVLISNYANTSGGTIAPYAWSTLASDAQTNFFRNRNLGTNPRTDSLVYNGSDNFFRGEIGVIYLNNNNIDHFTDNSVRWSIKKADTLPLTLVSLVDGWIKTAPTLLATTIGSGSYAGRLNKFILAGKWISGSYVQSPGAGGIFNNSAMYDTDGNSLFTNVYAGSPTYLANLAASVKSVNTTSVAVSGKTSAYLPIEYKFTIARTKKPI